MKIEWNRAIKDDWNRLVNIWKAGRGEKFAIVFVAVFLLGSIPYSLIAPLVYFIYRLVRHRMAKKYFESAEFQGRVREIEAVTQEHNDISNYVADLAAEGSLEIGYSKTGANAHLATTTNTSRWAYRRDRNVAHLEQANVHNFSDLKPLNNAKKDPISALIRHFGIQTSDDEVKRLEGISERMSRLENAVSNLHEREQAIEMNFNPPKFILKHYKAQFNKYIGLNLSTITVPYPQYSFEYVSAGGNSSQRVDILVTTEVMDKLISTLSKKVEYRASAAGQRALMTSAVRERIKARDNYTCQYCGVSVNQEPHLLLEVDHIVPVSKGGLSVDSNLQTLCWRCNRTKSNKTPSVQPVPGWGVLPPVAPERPTLQS